MEIMRLKKSKLMSLNETEEVKTDVYKCELCYFVSNKKSGLNIHMSRKHAHGMFLEQNIKSPDSGVRW